MVFWILLLVILPLAAVTILAQVMPANYVLLSAYKIVYLVPFVQRQKPWRSMFSSATFKRLWQLNVALSLLAVTIYIGLFYALSSFIDLSHILSRLQTMFAFTPQNIVLVAIYIVFINSLLEELFWRGYIFDHLRDRIHPVLAHGISAIGFASYHLYFIRTWISLPMFLLAFLGIAVFAIAMNLHYRKHRDMFSVWFIHLFADIAQMYIAFKLFGIL